MSESASYLRRITLIHIYSSSVKRTDTFVHLASRFVFALNDSWWITKYVGKQEGAFQEIKRLLHTLMTGYLRFDNYDCEGERTHFLRTSRYCCSSRSKRLLLPVFHSMPWMKLVTCIQQLKRCSMYSKNRHSLNSDHIIWIVGDRVLLSHFVFALKNNIFETNSLHLPIPLFFFCLVRRSTRIRAAATGATCTLYTWHIWDGAKRWRPTACDPQSWMLAAGAFRNFLSIHRRINSHNGRKKEEDTRRRRERQRKGKKIRMYKQNIKKEREKENLLFANVKPYISM